MLFLSRVQLCAVMCYLLSGSTADAFSTSVGESKKDVLCKRDVLIILDTSYSVGKVNFDRQVKPFLEELVMDKGLNVGPTGTQVSLMVFSDYSDPSRKNYDESRDKTKLLVHFKDNYDAETLKEYIQGLEWKKISGGSTRTDVALEIANTEVFPERNPFNNRQMSNDIIILITDGKPHGVLTASAKAVSIASELKAKGITIIGVGVGQQITNVKFWSILKQIASPGKAIRKKFEDLTSVRKWLEKKSCDMAALRCVCPESGYSPFYLKPNETSKSISWLAPSPVCAGRRHPVILDTAVEPPVRSPQNFKEGQHKIHYKFFLKHGSQVDCFVNIEVKACTCPESKPKIVQVRPGKTKAVVKWEVPSPTCVKCNEATGYKLLSIGTHSVGYTYNVGSNDKVTCNVEIEVKGWLCGNTPYDYLKQMCCSGNIYDRKQDYKCCGYHYFDTTQYRCCKNGWNIREKYEKCHALLA